MEIFNVEKKLNDKLLQYFKGEKDGYVQVGSKKWFYPMKYKKLAMDYKNFDVRSDDIWITGIPRSGTTVTQEIAWLLSHDLDFEQAKVNLAVRVPFFEGSLVTNEKTFTERLKSLNDEESKKSLLEGKKFSDNTLKILEERKDRRLIKTHLPYELLPEDILRKGCKVIYVCRYPKDVAVSYFHLQSNAWHINFVGDFPQYWQFFQRGNCMFGPYFEHVNQAVQHKENKNFLFVFYEDIKKNPTGYIEKLSEFLERPLSETELENVKKHINFENFQKNPAICPSVDTQPKGEFVRKGTSGGWKNYFSDDMNREADKWIRENVEKIGIQTPWKLQEWQ